ncbi:MAG: hypothetical protein JJ975_15880 [Bacteroidia bacterium]|nr:hypothetical protein [Bacteroidia bacterium]
MRKKIELYKAYTQGQEKLTYYLIALAVAAIGFSVTRSAELMLSIEQISLGIGVQFWAVSIFCGIRSIQYRLSHQQANLDLLRVEDGTHPEIVENPHHQGPAGEGILDAMEEQAVNGNLCSAWQLRLFYLGILAYLVWHVIQMYYNT